MYGLNRLTSAKYFLTAAAAAAYPKLPVRLSPPLRPFLLFNHFSLTPPTPAGIDDSFNVKNGDAIAGKDENQIPIIEDKIEYERKVLPPELHSKNVVLLTCDSAAPGGICDVYLVGTVHDSPKSERRVEDVIKFLKPQIAFLELCYLRPIEAKDSGEFALAFNLARKFGAKVIYGDRPLNITLKRAWAKMPLRHITREFLLSKTSPKYRKRCDEMVEKYDDDEYDVESRILQLESKLPTLVETFIHERDQYMSAKLLKVARKHNLVVAVVGKGHLAGIRKNWKQPVDMEELVRTPTLIIPKLVGVVAIIGGIYLFIKMS